MLLIPFLIYTMTLSNCVLSGKWFDSNKDDMAYVDNPVESGFPGHWLPVNLIKRIMEMRVRTTNEADISNSKPIFKKNDVSRQPLSLLKRATKMKEKPLTVTVKVSTVPSSVKHVVDIVNILHKDINALPAVLKSNSSSPTLARSEEDVTTPKMKPSSQERSLKTIHNAFITTTEMNTKISTNSKLLTLTTAMVTTIPLSTSTIDQTKESVQRDTSTVIVPLISTLKPKITKLTTKDITTTTELTINTDTTIYTRATTKTTTEMPTTTSEMSSTASEMITTKSEVPTTISDMLTTTSEMPTTTLEMPTTTLEMLTTTSEMPTTTSEMPTNASEITLTTTSPQMTTTPLTSTEPTTTTDTGNPFY